MVGVWPALLLLATISTYAQLRIGVTEALPGPDRTTGALLALLVAMPGLLILTTAARWLVSWTRASRASVYIVAAAWFGALAANGWFAGAVYWGGGPFLLVGATAQSVPGIVVISLMMRQNGAG